MKKLWADLNWIELLAIVFGSAGVSTLAALAITLGIGAEEVLAFTGGIAGAAIGALVATRGAIAVERWKALQQADADRVLLLELMIDLNKLGERMQEQSFRKDRPIKMMDLRSFIKDSEDTIGGLDAVFESNIKLTFKEMKALRSLKLNIDRVVELVLKAIHSVNNATDEERLEQINQGLGTMGILLAGLSGEVAIAAREAMTDIRRMDKLSPR